VNAGAGGKENSKVGGIGLLSGLSGDISSSRLSPCCFFAAGAAFTSKGLNGMVLWDDNKVPKRYTDSIPASAASRMRNKYFFRRRLAAGPKRGASADARAAPQPGLYFASSNFKIPNHIINLLN